MHIGLFGSDQSFALRYILYIFTNLLNWSHIVRFLLSGSQTIVTCRDHRIQSSQFIQHLQNHMSFINGNFLKDK
jgi:hypothetical protein